MVEPLRTAYAALVACFAAYAVASGLDWMWEFTVVSVVGFAALGLAFSGDPQAPHTERRLGLRVGLPLLAACVVVAQAVPLLATTEIRESQAAVGRRDLREALASATTAADLQPWAATPHLQRALVLEEAGRLAAARRAIRAAIERDRTDWRLWLVQARLETKVGAIRSARRSLRRAIALNPRSPLFAGA
jgi:tetratricopeptide (TPR) repeat protein